MAIDKIQVQIVNAARDKIVAGPSTPFNARKTKRSANDTAIPEESYPYCIVSPAGFTMTGHGGGRRQYDVKFKVTAKQQISRGIDIEQAVIDDAKEEGGLQLVSYILEQIDAKNLLPTATTPLITVCTGCAEPVIEQVGDVFVVSVTLSFSNTVNIKLKDKL